MNASKLSRPGSGIRAPSQPAIPGDYQYKALHTGPALQRFWHRGKLEVMDLVVSFGDGDVVVDVGCGSGNLSILAGSRARHVIGIDPSLDAVRFCRSRTEPAAAACGFVAALGDNLPVETGSADVGLLVEVLEHMEEPLGVLAEIRRALKPGGRLFVTTPNYGPGSLWPLLEWLADKSRLVAAMADEQHVAAYTPATLRELLVSAGFGIERVSTFYRFSPLVALASPQRGLRMLAQELDEGGQSGALILAIARR